MSSARQGGDPASKRMLELRLLGPLEVLSEGRAVGLGGAKPRTLLAVLALDLGRVVSVDRLVDALWPGEAPESAPHAVQVYVSQLRKALGPVIVTRSPGYALELAPECVDFHRFMRSADDGRDALQAGSPEAAEVALREALALWRGPALADFVYEPFAQTEIARLEELRTVVLEERIEADLALGRHAGLISELEALAQAQPLRERPRGQLMLALYRAGRQADALSAYRDARETLVNELGIEPGPELKGLEAAILRQDESLLLEDALLAKPAMQFRRLVTILFVDVVESMALADALDAEALGRVLQSYFETVSAAITRHGGAVEKYAGDAVMAAFGIPISHEDDALRAARAALDVRAGVFALNERLASDHGVGLEIRIGLESGEVVATPTDARQRLVTGEAVGIAAKLEQLAGADEIVVGELAGRLIDHVAQLESLGELEIKGKREPVRAYRLLDIAPVAPAFERRLDAPLVGRKRELAALRRALKRAVDRSTVRVVTVIGSPGVGKSRLAAELTGRAKGVTTLVGRCLSYGEGITYWPLREVLENAAESEQRDAVLTMLGADTPPPAREIALAFREYCAVLARERPLVLIFDDVHWAERTFLELLEHLVDRGKGPILVVCLAREELTEEHPEFLEGRSNADTLTLDALPEDATDALLDGLGGAILESNQRARITETAEGNPFFLEQLLALAFEGGLAERALPETVQALLAARLDRLGPGERAVLERGAVVGKEFTADDVTALLDPEAAPTAGVHLRTLAGRGFVRPRDEGAFGFRHVLVQEAVYRAAPKRLRADLHERYADRLDQTAQELPELDEFVGYHLEQAFRLRTDLGESDRRSARLAEDGGRRLGDAGYRSFRHGDMPAATGLMTRSISLLRHEQRSYRQLLCELGLASYANGDSDGALAHLKRALAESRATRDRYTESRAELELEYVRLRTEPGRTGDDLLAAADKGIALFESVDDQRALGRALLLSGWVRGGRRCDHRAWEDASVRALEHYGAVGWPNTTCLGELAAALYWGPTPVGTAIERCEELLRNKAAYHDARAYLRTFLGGLVAQQGDLERGRKLVLSARSTLRDLGLGTQATTYCSPVLSDIELLAGDAGAAAQVLEELCAELERSHQFSRLASAASELAEALTLSGSVDEADRWTMIAERHIGADDIHAQMRWYPVRASIHAHRGELALAEEQAREGVRVAERTDGLNRRADAQRELGHVLRLQGNERDAESAFQRAVHLYEQKENIVGAAALRALDLRAIV